MLFYLIIFVSAVLASPELEGNRIKPTPLPVCLDDSDCVKHGDKYACFQYFCYPWKDDKEVDEVFRKTTCREDSECDPGQSCYRHYDKRHINRGLCFEKILMESCEIESDCGQNYGCCGGVCCEMEYHLQFADLPCVSDLGCQDLGMGKYCCPKDNSTKVCCDTNPFPPTTPIPVHSPATGSGIRLQGLSSSVLSLIYLRWIINN